MSIYDLFIQFIDFKRTYCTDKTIIYYQDNVSSFLRWLDGRRIDRDAFQQYLLFLRSTCKKSVTVKTYFRAVKVFCSWLFDNGFIEENYCKFLKLPRDDADIKFPLSASEISIIDNVFDCSNLGIRNFLIFHFLLDCGLRCSEVINLKYDDFDLNKRLFKVFGKGHKYRVIPLPGNIYDALCIYKYRCAGEGSLFYDRYGKIIEYDTIKDLLNSLKKFVPRGHAHLLRHTFATSFLYYGGDIEHLRLLLGHQDIKTTQKYLHLVQILEYSADDIYLLDDCFYLFGRKKRTPKGSFKDL